MYLFVKNAVLGLGLGLVSTLTLTLKQNSLTKRYTPTSRFTDNQSPQSERLAGYRIVVDTWFCLAFGVGIKEVLAVLPALQILIIVTKRG